MVGHGVDDLEGPAGPTHGRAPSLKRERYRTLHHLRRSGSTKVKVVPTGNGNVFLHSKAGVTPAFVGCKGNNSFRQSDMLKSSAVSVMARDGRPVGYDTRVGNCADRWTEEQ